MNKKNERTWDDILVALKETHTTSFKDCCKMLKCHRTWINKNIRPYVDSIYIRSNHRGDHYNGTNWVMVAGKQIGKHLNDSIYFNTKELSNFLFNHLYSCTRQTISVPKTYLIKDSLIKKYENELAELEDELVKAKEEFNFEKRTMLSKAINELYLKYINEDERWLANHQANFSKRTKAKPVDFPIEELSRYTFMKLKAIHDLLDYGDAEETKYRELFREGAIRLEFRFNNNAKKIYYLDDPEPLKPKIEYDANLIIEYGAWLEYLKRKSN